MKLVDLMSHEAGLFDYFPSDLKRWVKGEDIGSDGVIECKSSIPTLSYEGRTAISSKDKASIINDYFSTCFNTMVSPLEDKADLSDCISSMDLDADKCPSDLVCTEEVYELLVKLDVIKANGADGISTTMLKKTVSSIYPALTNLFNQSIQSGHVPTIWKFSSVVPIPKES